MNLLVTGAFACTESDLNQLRKCGHEVIFMQQEKSPLPCDASWVEGVICNGIFLSHPIEHFTNLKFIQLTSAGFDRVPMEYVKEHNIEIHNARGVYSIPMAEFVISGILQLVKRSRFFYENQKQHIWEKSRTLGELAGKRAVIVGAGNIGSEVAKRLKAFDVTVVGIDITTDERPYFDKIELLATLDEQLKTADIVVLTLPLTDDTKGIFNKSKFDLLKYGAIFVNIARGQLVVENDLIDALNEKRLSGAVLDVFDTEPLEKTSPLWDMDNVIITPHNSFAGEGNGDRLSRLILSNIANRII